MSLTPTDHTMTGFWNSERAQNLTGAVVLAIVSMLCLFMMADADGGWSTSLTLTALLFAGTTLTFSVFVTPWSLSSRPRLLTLLWLELALIISLYARVEIAFVAILGIVWMVQAAETFSIRITSGLLVLMVLLFGISQWVHLGDDTPVGALSSAITLGLFHLFAVSTTYRAIREQALREQTAALNRELLATRELLAQSSRQSERLRIARDLHDTLGHHLTALILHLEVAFHTTEGTGRQKVEQALALGRLLLADLRSAVSELREDDLLDLRLALQTLVQDTPHLQISLNLEHTAVQDVQHAETLLRCAQEGLTNCLRHSGATHCTIALTRDKDSLLLQIADDGRGSAQLVPGNGLRGMRERVEALGGTVAWTSAPKGFTLHIRLPLHARQEKGS